MKFASAVAAIGLALAMAAGALSAQYQNAAYASDGSSYGLWITNVEVKQGATTLLSNSSGYTATPYNTFYSGVTPAALTTGTSHSITVTMGTGGAYYAGAGAWIDYNDDNDFLDAGEYLGGSNPNVILPGPTVINFTPASFTGSSLKRLRVRMAYTGSAGAVGPLHGTPNHPTDVFGYGEAEDYRVSFGFGITTPSPLPTGAIGIAYTTTIQAGAGVAPYTWQGATSYIVAGALPSGLTAAPVGDTLVISGTPTTQATYNFTVSVQDSTGGTPQSASKPFDLTIAAAGTTLPYVDTFSTNQGWQLGTSWAIAPSQPFTATTPPMYEPGFDVTPATGDNQILGDYIGGTYPINEPNTYWAVSPAVDCSAAQTVRLRFWRVLGLAPGTQAWIQASSNGSTWTNIWMSNIALTTYESSWTSVFYDITAIAAGNPAVRVRFGIGATGPNPHTGWCIDDLVIEVPSSDMVVREASPTGAIITDNQAVGGARDFGQVAAATQSAPLTIHVTNNGPSTINFGTITVTGAQATDFYLDTSPFQSSLAIGQTRFFKITFYRPTVGVSTATVLLPHNAAYSGTTPFEINVTGEAIPPQPIIRVNMSSPTGTQVSYNDPASGTLRDFGARAISAGPSASITLFITNAGTGSLTLGTIDLAGTAPGEFALNTTGTLSSLTAGQSTSFTVVFDPNSVGQKDAHVSIPHSDGTQTNPFVVPVTGNGAPTATPTMALEEAATGIADGGTHSYGAIPTGAATNIQFTIRNTGTSNLNLSGLPIVDITGQTQCTATVTAMPGSIVIAPAGSTTFDVDVMPAAPGSWSFQLSIDNNDPGRNPYDVTIDGTGFVPPLIRVNLGSPTGTQINHNDSAATTPRDFGSQAISAGATAAITIYITNAGSGTLSISTPDLGGTSPAEFVVNSAGMQSTLTAGQSTSFAVAFDPSTAGQKDAYVRIPHNDATQPAPFFVPVSGFGTTVPTPVMSLELGVATIANGATHAAGSFAPSVTVALTFIIRNTGTADLNLTGSPLVQVSGTVDCTAVLSASLPATLIAPTAMTSFDILLTPTGLVAWSFQLSIDNNDPARNPYDVTITGLGLIVATELRVTTQPLNSSPGQVFLAAPVIAITNAAGTVDLTDVTTQVQVAITTGTGNPAAVLSGTTTATAVNGYVIFTDLQISAAGNGYTLTFTDVTGPLGTVASNSFNIASVGGSDGGEEETKCSTGTGAGSSLPALLLLSLAALLLRRTRRAKPSA